MKSDPDPSGAMRSDGSASAAFLFSSGLGEDRAAPRFLEDRLAGARVHDVLRGFAHELLQAVRSAGVQPAFAGAVGVDVDGGLLLQFGVVLLRPLRRSQQAPLFAVPQRQNDRSRRAPPGLQQLPQTARRFHQRRCAADRIVGAAHPRIVMIAEDDPLIGPRRPRNAGDDVVERSILPLEAQVHVDLRGTGADVIRERQRALPFVRHHLALELTQDVASP